ncbi:MAG TPA: hypothetical protein VLF91_01470 [Candidatus Saccharimonadales bacterium]|nr:hypothetical protein [Candidatus Saccharimonadales bacterium]
MNSLAELARPTEHKNPLNRISYNLIVLQSLTTMRKELVARRLYDSEQVEAAIDRASDAYKKALEDDAIKPADERSETFLKEPTNIEIDALQLKLEADLKRTSGGELPEWELNSSLLVWEALKGAIADSMQPAQAELTARDDHELINTHN